ncbi:MAG: hypothetical protein IJU31_05540 [Synergistaceae bacterium]|nr:hypothetical protein [Synergistaceae bacterium]
MSGAVIGLNHKNFQKFKNFTEGSEALEPEVERSLLSNGFIVPYVVNEYDVINTKRIINMLNTDISFHRIVTTMDCNARCVYCYEGHKSHEYMNLETAEQTANFIIDRNTQRRKPLALDMGISRRLL